MTTKIEGEYTRALDEGGREWSIPTSEPSADRPTRLFVRAVFGKLVEVMECAATSWNARARAIVGGELDVMTFTSEQMEFLCRVLPVALAIKDGDPLKGWTAPENGPELTLEVRRLTPPPAVSQEFQDELARLINKHSQENGSDTPDFLLASFLVGCLEVWNSQIRLREKWFGRAEQWTPVGGSGDAPIPQ